MSPAHPAHLAQPTHPAQPAHDVRRSILATAQPIIGGKGYSAVGLNEILKAAAVPKGSFYHYFASKEEFGAALLEHYFDAYLADLDATLAQRGVPALQRLMGYWDNWRAAQAANDPQGQCLAVKLAAEVSDLSEAMRAVLRSGTDRIVGRLSAAVAAAQEEGSLDLRLDAGLTAAALYQLWLGASLRAKITRDGAPLEQAMLATRCLLGLSA